MKEGLFPIKMKNVHILFDNSAGVVYSGQILSGKVQLNCNSSKKVKAISIVFKGIAHVNWTQKEQVSNQHKQNDQSVNYFGHEDYFTHKLYLLGSADNSDNELASGEHSLPFSFSVPPIAPSSFEGEKGFVRYTVTVTIDRSWKFDKLIKKAFTVISPLDLNYNPRLRNPMTSTIFKNFHCCFFKSGHIAISASVPYTGFVGGQPVLFTLKVENTSRRTVRDIKFVLFKTVVYHSTWPTKVTTKTKEKVTQFKIGKSFGPGSSSTFNESLLVPLMAPTHLMNCGLIDVFYVIQIKAMSNGLHKNRMCLLPIEIGTVPLANLETMAGTDQNTSDLNDSQGQSAPVGWNPNISDSSTAYLLPPPAYEDTQFGVPPILGDNMDSRGFVSNKKMIPDYTVLPTAPTDPVAGPSAPLHS